MQQIEDSLSALDADVQLKLEFRSNPQMRPPGKLAAQQSYRAVQRFETLLLRLLVAQHTDEDLGMTQITRDLRPCQCHKTQSRIPQVTPDDLTDLLHQLLLHPLLSNAHHCLYFYYSKAFPTQPRRL